MPEILSAVSILLFVVVLALLLVLVRRGGGERLGPQLQRLMHEQERSERLVREEMARNREEAGVAARQVREEVATAVKGLGDSVVAGVGQLGSQQKNQLDTFAAQLVTLTESNEKRLAELRAVVDERLRQLQQENSAKLDEMRRTVDERLESTLEKRLGESFKQVSERLEAVHQGLGEMQALAVGVGDLKKVLSNVKARGTWGEVALSQLLDQILTVDQYDVNVCCRLGSNERVEFAVRLPGRDGLEGEVVLLPIDAKFPLEDYQRLLAAQEMGDVAGVEVSGKALEARVKASAKDIRTKYLDPPRTTDFGIMFLPNEGLYAEVLRRPGLIDTLQGEYRVVVAGPTTIAALLNSLQMGFRTLAIEKRSSEVWQLLGAVKTQFGKFGDVLDQVHKKLDQASNTIEDAARKSRTIERSLRSVEELPAEEAQALLPVQIGAEDALEGRQE